MSIKISRNIVISDESDNDGNDGNGDNDDISDNGDNDGNGDSESDRSEKRKLFAPPIVLQHEKREPQKKTQKIEIVEHDDPESKLFIFFDDFLRNMILPNIRDYINSQYNDNITVERLTEIVYKKRMTRNSTNDTVIKRKPKEIDVINGCQYIIDRSKIRKGSKCGNPRERGSYFCKYCKDKTSFPMKARKLAEELGLSFFEVAGCEENELPDKKRVDKSTSINVRGRGRGNSNVSSSGSVNGSVSDRVNGSGRGRGNNRNETNMSNMTITPEENITLNFDDVEGLHNIVSDTNHNIIFYMDNAEDEDSLPVAFGQWDENGKIVPMTAPTKAVAKTISRIGNYNDYISIIGKYSIDYVTDNSNDSDNSNGSDSEVETSTTGGTEGNDRTGGTEGTEVLEVRKKRILKINIKK